MNTGKHAFTVVYNYVLAAMNNAAEQPLAGQFALAPMPGEAHATLGFTKFYAITAQAAKDPARARGGVEVRQLHGRQALHGREALGGRERASASASCSLFDDPDVQAAWNKWIDFATLKQQVATARGRHVDGMDVGVVGLFPAAACQGHGR